LIPSLYTLVIQSPILVTKGLSVVQIKDLSSDAFEVFLQWIYCGETDFSVKIASELIQFCVDNHIHDLLHICIDTMKKNINTHSFLFIMGACHIQNKHHIPEKLGIFKGIKRYCIEYALNHFSEIDFNSFRNQRLHPSVVPEILIAIQNMDIKQEQEDKKNKVRRSKSTVMVSSPVANWSSIEVNHSKKERKNPTLLRRLTKI